MIHRCPVGILPVLATATCQIHAWRYCLPPPIWPHLFCVPQSANGPFSNARTRHTCKHVAQARAKSSTIWGLRYIGCPDGQPQISAQVTPLTCTDVCMQPGLVAKRGYEKNSAFAIRDYYPYAWKQRTRGWQAAACEPRNRPHIQDLRGDNFAEHRPGRSLVLMIGAPLLQGADAHLLRVGLNAILVRPSTVRCAAHCSADQICATLVLVVCGRENECGL
jgi:hypothetical protein